MSSMWICRSHIFFNIKYFNNGKAFVHDLDPNGNQVPDAPEWPEYGSSGEHIVFQGFGNGSFVEKDDFREEGIRFIIEQTEMGVRGL